MVDIHSIEKTCTIAEYLARDAELHIQALDIRIPLHDLYSVLDKLPRD